LARRKWIPQLFRDDAEIPFSTDAMNAFDDTFTPPPNTIDQKFGASDKPLHKAIRNLTKEILKRLKLPIPTVPDVDVEAVANPEFTKSFVE
jgi:hypothetical protein